MPIPFVYLNYTKIKMIFQENSAGNYFLYKYTDLEDGIVKYIGITKNLPNRISQHKRDKLAGKDWKIEYLKGMTKEEAELAEYVLINEYRTFRYYNVAKSKFCKCSFLSEAHIAQCFGGYFEFVPQTKAQVVKQGCASRKKPFDDFFCAKKLEQAYKLQRKNENNLCFYLQVVEKYANGEFCEQNNDFVLVKLSPMAQRKLFVREGILWFETAYIHQLFGKGGVGIPFCVLRQDEQEILVEASPSSLDSETTSEILTIVTTNKTLIRVFENKMRIKRSERNKSF